MEKLKIKLTNDNFKETHIRLFSALLKLKNRIDKNNKIEAYNKSNYYKKYNKKLYQSFKKYNNIFLKKKPDKKENDNIIINNIKLNNLSPDEINKIRKFDKNFFIKNNIFPNLKKTDIRYLKENTINKKNILQNNIFSKNHSTINDESKSTKFNSVNSKKLLNHFILNNSSINVEDKPINSKIFNLLTGRRRKINSDSQIKLINQNNNILESKNNNFYRSKSQIIERNHKDFIIRNNRLYFNYNIVKRKLINKATMTNISCFSQNLEFHEKQNNNNNNKSLIFSENIIKE